MQTPGTRGRRSRSFSLGTVPPRPAAWLADPSKSPARAAAAWAGDRQGPQASLTRWKPPLSGVQGFLGCPAQPIHKPTVLGGAKLQRPAIKPTRIKEKTNLPLAFSFANAAALFSLYSVPTLRLCLTSQSAPLPPPLPVRGGCRGLA